MSDNQPVAVSLLTRETLIQGTTSKDSRDHLFDTMRDVTVDSGYTVMWLDSVSLSPIGSNVYPVTTFPKWKLSYAWLMFEALAVLPGDENAATKMKKVWKELESKNPINVVIYTGPYMITGQALSKDLSDDIDTFAYFPVMNAKVSCLLPQNHFAEMNVPYLVVNSYHAQFFVQ
jgi:hypothetical protein